MDLDWFWNGWFFSTDHVDIALESVYEATLDTLNPSENLKKDREDFEKEPKMLFDERNLSEGIIDRVTLRPELLDIYDEYDEFTPSNREMKDYEEILDDLYDRNNSDPEWKKKALVNAVSKDEFYYILKFKNVGGLVMPIPLQINYENGTNEIIKIPAEIWRKNPNEARWLKRSKIKIQSVIADPFWEIADVDIENNYYPQRMVPARLRPNASNSNPKNLMKDLMERNKEINSHN